MAGLATDLPSFLPSSLPWSLPSSLLLEGLQRHDPVVGDIAVTDSLNTQLLHGFADVDFGSLSDGECGVVIMQNLQHNGLFHKQIRW